MFQANSVQLKQSTQADAIQQAPNASATTAQQPASLRGACQDNDTSDEMMNATNIESIIPLRRTVRVDYLIRPVDPSVQEQYHESSMEGRCRIQKRFYNENVLGIPVFFPTSAGDDVDKSLRYTETIIDGEKLFHAARIASEKLHEIIYIALECMDREIFTPVTRNSQEYSRHAIPRGSPFYCEQHEELRDTTAPEIIDLLNQFPNFDPQQIYDICQRHKISPGIAPPFDLTELLRFPNLKFIQMSGDTRGDGANDPIWQLSHKLPQDTAPYLFPSFENGMTLRLNLVDWMQPMPSDTFLQNEWVYSIPPDMVYGDSTLLLVAQETLRLHPSYRLEVVLPEMYHNTSVPKRQPDLGEVYENFRCVLACFFTGLRELPDAYIFRELGQTMTSPVRRPNIWWMDDESGRRIGGMKIRDKPSWWTTAFLNEVREREEQGWTTETSEEDDSTDGEME